MLHPQLLLPSNPGDNMHVLYSAEEIASRMAKVRVKHMDCTDRVEAMLLQGEYKYFSGKKIHFQHVRPDVLISFLQSFSYFGFFSAVNLKNILHIIRTVIPDMSLQKIDLVLHYLATMQKHDEDLLAEIYDVLEVKIEKAAPSDAFGILVSLDRLNCDRPRLIRGIASKYIGRGDIPGSAVCAFLNLFAKMEQHKDSTPFLPFLEKAALSTIHELTPLEHAQLLRNFVVLSHFKIGTHEKIVAKWAKLVLNYFESPVEAESTSTDSEAVDEYPRALSFVLEALAKLEYCHPLLVIKAIDILEDIYVELDGSSAARCLLFLATLYEREKMHLLRPLINSVLGHMHDIRAQIGVIFTRDVVDTLMDSMLLLPKDILSQHREVHNILSDQVLQVTSIKLKYLLKILRVCEKHPWALPINQQEVLFNHLVFLTTEKGSSSSDGKYMLSSVSHDQQQREPKPHMKADIFRLANMLREERM